MDAGYKSSQIQTFPTKPNPNSNQIQQFGTAICAIVAKCASGTK
jgi:hypothetical protein